MQTLALIIFVVLLALRNALLGSKPWWAIWSIAGGIAVSATFIDGIVVSAVCLVVAGTTVLLVSDGDESISGRAKQWISSISLVVTVIGLAISFGAMVAALPAT